MQKTTLNVLSLLRLSLALFTALFFLIVVDSAYATQTTDRWTLLGPGDADMVSSLNILPDGRVLVGTDIGGIYISENKGTSWTPHNSGLYNYDISTPILQDPNKKNILYVGTRGGFFKSIDNGTTWEAKRKGFPRSGEYTITSPVGALALHPKKPGFLYLAFGVRPDKQNVDKLFYRKSFNGKIYLSTDYGESWQVLGATTPGVAFHNFAFSPLDPDTMFAATSKGALCSQDGGRSWDYIYRGDTRCIMSLQDGLELLFTAGKYGVFHSRDGGASWDQEINGLPVGTKNNYSLIYLTPNRDKIYVLNSSWAGTGGVYSRGVREKMWRKVFTHSPLKKAPCSWLKPSRRANAIAVDPNNSHRIFLGTSRYLYRSEDSGKTWSQLISRRIFKGKWTHTGINVFGGTLSVAVDPLNPKRIYVGTADHGLVISEDGGKSWFPPTISPKHAAWILDIQPDPVEPGRVLRLDSDNKGLYWLSESTDYGRTWSKKGIGNKKTVQLNSLLQDKCIPNVIFIAAKSGIFRSIDRGENWKLYQNGFPKDLNIRKLILHPKKNNLLYAATDGGLYISEDAGRNWHFMHGTSYFDMYAVMIDKYYPKVLFIGTRRTQHSSGGLWKSTDGGKKWKKVLDVRWISAIIQVPDSEIFYALTNNENYHDRSSGQGVFRSTNGGSDWVQINEGLAVLRGRALSLSTHSPHQIYVGTNGSGLYVRTDPSMTKPLPVPVSRVEIPN